MHGMLETGRAIGPDATGFRTDLDRVSFGFSHQWAQHPLLQVDRLSELARAILEGPRPQNFVVFEGAQLGAGTGFGAVSSRARVADSVRLLDQGGAWMKLSNAQAVDPAYAALVDIVIDDIDAINGGDFRSKIAASMFTVFMASPGIVTPYHMDHELNLLLQIQGEKEYWLFDPTDPDILTEPEIELYYHGDYDAARYKAALQERGTVFHLKPGLAVHHPPLAPHMVKNGATVSVSASIGFRLHRMDARAEVYRANRLLRRLGLRPTPPGGSAVRDQLKRAGMRVVNRSFAVRDELARRGPGKPQAAQTQRASSN